jgi:hypothetical protein
MEATPAGRRVLGNAQGAETLMDGEVLGEFVAQHFGDTHTLTVRRATFLELGGYPTGFAVCEDVNFLIRLCARSTRVGVVCAAMAAYRIHGQSATRSNPLRAQRQTVAALKTLVPQLGGAPPYIRRGLRAAIAHARMDLAMCLLRLGKRAEAVAVVLPLLGHFNVPAIRTVLSVVKGALSA